MKVGYYPHDNQKLVRVTSFLDNLFGIPDEDREKWTIKEAILAVTRQAKKEGRILSQAEAIALGQDARLQILRRSQTLGVQVHQYAQNLNNGLPYELEEEYRGYGEAYYNWWKDHTLETILDETKLKNVQYGYAGRIDWYGKLDGKFVLLDFKTSKAIRWSYHLQLAAYKQCLEDMGYPVEAMYLVHLKPKKRGGSRRIDKARFNLHPGTKNWLTVRQLHSCG